MCWASARTTGTDSALNTSAYEVLFFVQFSHSSLDASTRHDDVVRARAVCIAISTVAVDAQAWLRGLQLRQGERSKAAHETKTGKGWLLNVAVVGIANARMLAARISLAAARIICCLGQWRTEGGCAKILMESGVVIYAGFILHQFQTQ